MAKQGKISLRKFALSLGFNPSTALSWKGIPEFRECLEEVKKGRVRRYFITDPEKAKEALKNAGYCLPSEE